jgi:hypothetical protein
VETKTDKILLRPHIHYNLILKIDLAKQLSGVTLRLANSLKSLVYEDVYFEIITGLQQDLEAEKKAVEGQAIKAVTIFPIALKKQLRVCYPNTMPFLKLLTDLDKVVQQWHDLYFLGNMSREEFKQKKQEWRTHFWQASLKVNAFVRRNGKNRANGKDGKSGAN